MKTKLLTIATLAVLMLTATIKGQAQTPCLPQEHGLTTHQSAMCGVTQSIALTSGWNWISSYIEQDGETGMTMLEQSLGENAEVIKSMTDMNEFDGEDWYGEMPLELEQMYMVYVSENCSAVLEGTPANPADHPINITEGWNWIGFPCDQEVSIADAFAGFTPEDGDAIKTFSGLAEYFDGEWFPDEELETLKPGQGYMYYSGSSTPKTLTFQTGAKTRRAYPNFGKINKQLIEVNPTH